MKTVLILCGGQSPEHEISLRSARNVLNALDRTLFSPRIIGITPTGKWIYLNEIPDGSFLQDGPQVAIVPGANILTSEDLSIKPDVVFPVLHGPHGEDGSVQGLLQLLNVPFVGPHVLGSAVAMDKDVAKKLLKAAGLKVAKGMTFYPDRVKDYDQCVNELGPILFVKPANMGSSVGVHKVRNKDEFEAAIKDAFQYDHKAIVEEMITGREVECAVLGVHGALRVTAPGEIRAQEEYSFDEKYSESSVTQLDVPAKNIDSAVIEQLKSTALRAFEALNCEVMSRVDMFLTKENDIYVNEINTLPGFTSISMYPALWQHEGLSYSALITELLNDAIKRQQRIASLKKVRL